MSSRTRNYWIIDYKTELFGLLCAIWEKMGETISSFQPLIQLLLSAFVTLKRSASKLCARDMALTWSTERTITLTVDFKEARLSITALRACVYIYIRQLSSFRAPTLWFIDLTIWSVCYSTHFSEFMPLIFFTKKRTKRENTRRWPPTVTRRARY